MRVVYSDVHLRHDITHETILGEEIPAYEVAERAERIRDALDADGGFERVAPTGHGLGPILAVHDEGFVRFLESAWSGVRARGDRAPGVDPRYLAQPARCSRA